MRERDCFVERGHRELRVGDRRSGNGVGLGEKEKDVFRGSAGVAGTHGEGLLGLRMRSQVATMRAQETRDSRL